MSLHLIRPSQVRRDGAGGDDLLPLTGQLQGGVPAPGVAHDHDPAEVQPPGQIGGEKSFSAVRPLERLQMGSGDLPGEGAVVHTALSVGLLEIQADGRPAPAGQEIREVGEALIEAAVGVLAVVVAVQDDHQGQTIPLGRQREPAAQGRTVPTACGAQLIGKRQDFQRLRLSTRPGRGRRCRGGGAVQGLSLIHI